RQRGRTMKKNIPAHSLLTALAILLASMTAVAQTEVKQGQQDSPFYKTNTAPSSKGVASASISQQYEKEGILVEFSLNSIKGEDGKQPGLLVGSDAIVSFKVTDKRTGQPVVGLRPTAWINSRTAEHAPN